MTKTGTHSSITAQHETAAIALSPAARRVSESLVLWRVRLTETQTLARLILSLLKGSPVISAERREQLGRLLTVEVRTLAQLPRLEFASLRSTTNALESGIELRGPDAALAEAYLVRLRDVVGRYLVNLAHAIPAGEDDGAGAVLVAMQHPITDLLRAIDLMKTVLHPRMRDPVIAIGQAIERAAAPRGQSFTTAGDTEVAVWQVRGLLRLLSELITAVGESAYVHASRKGARLYVTLAPLATGTGEQASDPARDELLRLAGYLLRVKADRADGAWRLALVVAEGAS
jgi:hypothetical protein